MIHKVKCPKCKHEFDLDTGEKIEGSTEIAITKCFQCGFPLINKNQGDNWEILKPSDMKDMPSELQFMIAKQLLPEDEIQGLKETMDMMKQVESSTTPLDRARIFVPWGVCNSEGCVLVLSHDEWGKLSALSSLRKRPELRDALHHVVTKDYEQKITDN